MREPQTTVQGAIGLLTLIGSALASVASLTASIIAAVKAWKAESTSKKTNAVVEELKTILVQSQHQRQIQQTTINLGTGGDAKGGEIIDLSEVRPPAEHG
jgi:hypothetical protein